MLKKRVISVFQFVVFLGLGLFLLWLSTRTFTQREINQVKRLIWDANTHVVILCVFILLWSHYIRALRWRSMIQPLGVSPSAINVFLSVLIGYFMNLLFPRLGEVMKCTLLGKYEKIPVDKLVGTMVAERVIDLFCLIMVIAATILTQLDLVGNYAQETWNAVLNKYNPDGKTLLAFGIVLILVFLLLYRMSKKAKGKGIWEKMSNLLKGIYDGLTTIRHIQDKKRFFFYTLLIWVLYFLSIRLGFLAMDAVLGLDYVAALTILTFGSFAMIATQGGIGAYQIIVQKTLTLYQINEVSGLAFGWLLWSVQTIMLMGAGPLAFFLIFYINKIKKKRP